MLTQVRRRWYAARPAARRRLARPVISVGNLAVGGSGKSPLVAYLAGQLRERGERPAILSRGYGRTAPVEGVVVVHDGVRMRADLPRAGDEPLMLARALDGVAVLVAPDRYLAGRLAESALDCTVHLLDDGFQHLGLHRDVDLLLMGQQDLADRPLPSGRLREPIAAATCADAVILTDDLSRATLSARVPVARTFRARFSAGAPQAMDPGGLPLSLPPATRVLGVAGIARPERFFAGLGMQGWEVVGAVTFPDHHPYTRADVTRLARQVEAERVDWVLTTEKDLVRLLPLRPIGLPLGWIPLRADVEPAEEFWRWIDTRIQAARRPSAV